MIFNKKITLVGAGNIATHLGMNFFKEGCVINEVFSRDINNAEILARRLDCTATNQINKLKTNADIYIVCIKDDFIENIAKKLSLKDKIIVHTSGSVGMNVLQKFTNYGIFYPLQTFSKNSKIAINNVPFCIEANNNKTEQFLVNLAKTLSPKVYLINSEQRKKIHLAAVFACNFTNFMYQIAADISTKNNIDFDILKPLILATAKKIEDNSPKLVQTGPAKRKDEEVIKNHIKMLADNKDYQEIYRLISDSIKKE